MDKKGWTSPAHSDILTLSPMFESAPFPNSSLTISRFLLLMANARGVNPLYKHLAFVVSYIIVRHIACHLMMPIDDTNSSDNHNQTTVIDRKLPYP